MAEEKKEEKKEDKGKEKKDEVAPAAPTEISGWAIIGAALLLGVLVQQYNTSGALIQRYFTVSYLLSLVPESIIAGFKAFAVSYIILANIVSLFFLIALVYALIKMIEVEKQWYAQVYPEIVPDDAQPTKNSKWELVMNHIATDNPSDWRLAILESDIILDDLLDQLGYVGDTIGDKLKKVVRGDFQSLDKAWEAHKIRNAIAHEGQDFVLTQREAQRIVGLYQTVFQEFDYI